MQRTLIMLRMALHILFDASGACCSLFGWGLPMVCYFNMSTPFHPGCAILCRAPANVAYPDLFHIDTGLTVSGLTYVASREHSVV